MPTFFVFSVLLAVLVCLAACTICANEWEPRLFGKADVYQQLAAAEGMQKHVLPFALISSLTQQDEAVRAATELGLGSSHDSLIVKPNALTSCGDGVHVVKNFSELSAAVRDVLRVSPAALIQRRVASEGGIEARLYGTFALADGVWEWDPLVFSSAPPSSLLSHSDYQRVPMSSVLRRELKRVMRALPGVRAAALDVRAPSLLALQQGTFAILEVNGVGGIPHTWQVNMGDFFPWITIVMALDLVRWFPPRLLLGLWNVLTFRVDLVRRLCAEMQQLGVRCTFLPSFSS